MKRRVSPTASPAEQDHPRRRRQPQTSCNFCRSKKLKCDRGQPCANCTTRGISCEGQALSPPHTFDHGTGATGLETVLQRLHRLEDAVFGATGPAAAPGANVATSAQPSSSQHTEAPLSNSNRSRRDCSAELDYNQTGPIIDECALFTFHITANGKHSGSRGTSSRCIDIPCREDALALFKEYLDTTEFHIANLIHYPAAQAMVHDLYTQLRQGQKVSLSSVAFVLGFCAASAFFWDPEFPSGFDFLSEENAAACSRSWRASAFELLDQSQRAGLNSMDTIIARIILSDLVYNMEGISARYRYIQSAARAAAYEMGLHLIDLPAPRNGDIDPDREIKRRVWWYLVSTDWLLGAMGGPSSRLYTVNQSHMQVNYPQYIACSDPLVAIYGEWAETALLYLNMRTRLGDICRQVVDALPLGSADIDSLPYSKIAALDQLFEKLQLDIPAEMSSTDPTTQKLALQRSLSTLSLNARWARLLRPLLQANNLPEQFEIFRSRCLKSTETVIYIASSILSAAVDSPNSTDSGSSHIAPRRSPYRSGLIINHLFMACTVLATDPALRENAATEESTQVDAGTERRRSELANACRLLEKAGEKSAMAAAMVRRLLGVLRKHGVHGVHKDGRSLRIDDASASGKPTVPGQNAVQQVQQVQHSLAVANNSMAPLGQQQGVPSGWDSDIHTMDPVGLDLDGIWDEFFETNPTDDGWQQLFADLDSFAGGV